MIWLREELKDNWGLNTEASCCRYSPVIVEVHKMRFVVAANMCRISLWLRFILLVVCNFAETDSSGCWTIPIRLSTAGWRMAIGYHSSKRGASFGHAFRHGHPIRPCHLKTARQNTRSQQKTTTENLQHNLRHGSIYLHSILVGKDPWRTTPIYWFIMAPYGENATKLRGKFPGATSPTFEAKLCCYFSWFRNPIPNHLGDHNFPCK